MICLLCYDSNNEFISVDSEQGTQSKLSGLLYKYFRFCFDCEPHEGDVCLKCWQKLLTFHEFYIQIESIHDTLYKSKDLLGSPQETLKVEINEENLKCEQSIDDDWFHNELVDDLSSHNSNEGVNSLQRNVNGFILDFPAKDTLQTNLSTVPSSNLVRLDSSTDTKAKCIQKITIKKERKKSSKSKKRTTSRRGRQKNAGRPIMFTCKIRMCMEEFETMDALISHKTAAHRRIQCTYCPDLKLVVDLNKHLRTTHGIMQKSMCERCGEVYLNTRSLQDHIQRKHEVNEPLQCDICKEWFKSRDTIRAHMNYVHVQGPQKCDTCGKISANRKALRKHQTIHMESWKDRFKCVICCKGFRDSTKLKEHSYIHTGITDAYFCQFCGQSFRFGSSLSAHRMKYHPAEMAHVKDRLQRKKNLEFKV